LFDEPLSNLDAKLRAQTRLEIQKLHAELGVTSLFVTHDQVEAMTLAERMIVMNAGRMEQFGTPDEVYWTPATTFVASFIGSPAMNLMNAASLPLARDLLPPGQQGQDLTLGVRPEHITVVEEGGWPMKVEMTELLGAERLIYGKLADAAMIIIRINATDAAPKRGDTISVLPQTKYLHWFDAQGKRI
jgi:sn-glycerol 3-phosphate transport system ATP-binding protein